MTDRSLNVESDLTFSVTGPSGPVTGTVEASGATVTVRTSDPVATLDAALGGQPYTPSAIEALVARLADSGITVAVSGPQGTVATIGAGVSSTVGRVLAGSRLVRPGSLRAVAPLTRVRVAPALQGLPSTVRWLSGAAAAGMILWALARLARRRTPT